jgi:hypothetical protein
MKYRRSLEYKFENLYSSKLENLEEINKFLYAFNQFKLNKEVINHLNRSKTMRLKQ